MKKKRLILLSVILITALLLTGIPHASAINAPDIVLIGDVDSDNDVTILDATVIQRRLAGIRELSALEEFLGDVDCDNDLTILDATIIQRRLADLGDEFWCGSIMKQPNDLLSLSHMTYYPQNRYNGNIFADTEARIQFYADNQFFNRAYPTRYDIYINNEKVADHIEQKYYDYLFETAGIYTVKVVPYCIFGEGRSITRQLNVLDSPDRPYIADANFNDKDSTLSVRATGGAGGYRYRYYIRYEVPAEPATEPATEAETEPEVIEPPTAPPFGYEIQPDGTYQMVSDYTDASVIYVPVERLNEGLEYRFYVSAIDRNGVESPLSEVIIQSPLPSVIIDYE